MITQQTYSLLALHVYAAKEEFNKPKLPAGWAEVLPQPLGTSGFAYAVYKNASTNEIVISYRGTDKLLSGDMLTNLGLSVSQERQAAEVYTRVLRDNPTFDITFTGHSLGGGLAGTMAVWFNRPAVVFDPAPTEQGARDWLNVRYVIANLAAPVPQAILDYRDSISTQFAARESNVTSYYAPGSIIYSGNQSFNTITGSGQGNPVNFGIANMSSAGDRVNMHSQALLTAGLLTPAFPTATVALQTALPVIMNKGLYALPTSGSEPNFLINLIRSEHTTPNDSKLDNFSEDLNKLGTNLTGLNAAAQKAIIAQGIEWYYWQGTDYAGQNFFINNATYPSLLQYTSAVGAALPGAQNKSFLYTQKWLSEVYVAHGGTAGTTFPPFGTLFDQWSVATGSNAVTVTARDNNKNQIYIGGAGTDTFTASNAGDVILAGGGADSISGGTGGDRLYGGQGNDEYSFNASFGADLIQDSDGAGEMKVDGTTLDGGKKVDDNVWESADGVYRYQLFSHGATSDLVIGRGSKASCRNPRSMNIKMHSSLCTLHETRGRIRFRIRFASRLKQPQYTFNGYSESQFHHPFKTKAATCAH